MSDPTYECVVVGGSVAGLSAALTLGRARRRTLVVDAGQPINATVEHSHGFLSRDGIAPAELLRIGREQLEPYDSVELRSGTVTAVHSVGPDRFSVTLGDGSTVEAQRIVLAGGMRYDLAPIPGLREAWGRGVAHCPYCHGWEVRDRPLALIAFDATAVRHLGPMLQQWSADVTVMANDVDLGDVSDLERLGLRVVTGAVTAVEHVDGEVEAVVAGDVRVEVGAAFVALLPTPDARLTKTLGLELTEQGWPVVDPVGATSVPGVWAAGNAASSMQNLIASAASGALVAAGINRNLTEARVAAVHAAS